MTTPASKALRGCRDSPPRANTPECRGARKNGAAGTAASESASAAHRALRRRDTSCISQAVDVIASANSSSRFLARPAPNRLPLIDWHVAIGKD
jgi:hypothetical protein